MLKVDESVKLTEILKHITREDYVKGRNYFRPYVDLENKKTEKNIEKIYFDVESERTIKHYKCQIDVDRTFNKITYLHCTCPQFNISDSCKHLGACFANYSDDIFKVILNEELKENITKRIFDTFKLPTTKKNNVVKEEVKIEVYLEGANANDYYNNHLELILKIGTNKLYVCRESKIKKFLESLSNDEDFQFTKNFTFSKTTHYFSKENEELINFLSLLVNYQKSNYYSNSIIFGKNTIVNFFKLLSKRTFYLNNFLIKEVSNEFPFNTLLVKKDNKYHLNLEFNQFIPITSDLEYLQIDNKLFHTDERMRNILFRVFEYELEELIFDEEQKEKFTKNILPSLKKNITIDSSVDDIKITKELKPKLYFDLYRDKIICSLKLNYDDIEIDYFDKNSGLLREIDKEEMILEDLYKQGFTVEKERITLSELDQIGYFFEEGLKELTEKYEVFTSEKLKRIQVVKKSSIKSTFSIGSDNILKYSFDLGDIKEEEIVNILSSIKDKKKYFRLKSGDLLDLENNEELKELENLQEDMNLSKKDLESKSGIIPKYRAIYLDSLRNDKYHIIETNNLFDDLIEKFKKYRDADISLNKEEKEILRSYQIDGVKWLYNIDKTGFGGILADEMGLGKSIQTIYYIKELLKENKDYKFLIVSPTSLAYNWENEFNKFGSELKYKIISGTRNKRREELNNIDDINVIITTYGLLREDKEIYTNISFKTMIIDEAQNIKNVNAEITKTVKSINASTKFALTGTPIENSLLELWSIFDYIMPGFLTNMQSFEKKYRINTFDDNDNQKINKLNKLVSPFILRRRKKDVIKDLPDKIENNIYVDLTKEQKQLYLAELEKVKNDTDGIMETGGINKVRFMMLNLLLKLRQICIDPRIIYESYNGGSGKMEEFKKVVLEQVLNGHKILVFTSFKTALNLAKEELRREGITSYTIDGSVNSKKRMELVDKFNSDSTNVFFIMIKAGGTGLNLTSADVVIHLDLWWNPQAENQATDRAHRIGQKNVVSVIKFVSKGTIEEKILELQQKKKMLSDKVLDENQESNLFSELTEKDIKELLSYDEEE